MSIPWAALFDTYWTELFRLLMPWADLFFKTVTELGSDYVYIILIAIGFWTINRRESIITTFILIVSIVSNYWLKITFQVPRPSSINWLTGVDVSNYSLPSGHAQNSTMFWGWIGLKIQKWWMTALSILFVILIGLSRVYLGVHWLGDVLLGWTIGLILLGVLWRLGEPIQLFLSRFNFNQLCLGLIVFGSVSMILTELISPVTILGLEDNFGVQGGLIIGLGIGLLLEKKYVDFKTSSNEEKWRKLLRITLGLILVFVIMLALSPLLPSEIYWLRAIRYALSAIVVTFVWPFLFKKFNV